MTRRRHAVHPHRHATRHRDLGGHLRRRQHATVARLGALRQLDLDHLDLVMGGIGNEALLAETTLLVTATEVARADLPYQVTAHLAVVGRDRTLAGVVIEAALARAFVQRADGIGRQ